MTPHHHCTHHLPTTSPGSTESGALIEAETVHQWSVGSNVRERILPVMRYLLAAAWLRFTEEGVCGGILGRPRRPARNGYKRPDSRYHDVIRSSFRLGAVGLSVVVAVAISACSGDLAGVQKIHDEGIAQLEVGEWEAAVAAFSQVIDLEPGDTDFLAQAYVNRSHALGQLGRFEEAVADVTAAIDLEPVDADGVIEGR